MSCRIVGWIMDNCANDPIREVKITPLLNCWQIMQPVKRGHKSSLLHFQGSQGKKVQNHFLMTSTQSVSSTRTGLAGGYFPQSSTPLLTKPSPKLLAASTSSLLSPQQECRAQEKAGKYMYEMTSQVSFHGGLGSCFVRLRFAVVIKLLIAVLTQLLLRALIIFYAVAAASARLLGTGIVINLL